PSFHAGPESGSEQFERSVGEEGAQSPGVPPRSRTVEISGYESLQLFARSRAARCSLWKKLGLGRVPGALEGPNRWHHPPRSPAAGLTILIINLRRSRRPIVPIREGLRIPGPTTRQEPPQARSIQIRQHVEASRSPAP